MRRITPETDTIWPNAPATITYDPRLFLPIAAPTPITAIDPQRLQMSSDKTTAVASTSNNLTHENVEGISNEGVTERVQRFV